MVFSTLIPNNALAYVDPSTTTLLIQAVITIGIAIVAGVSIYWRKAKKKVADKLGIDENANKTLESDEITFTKKTDATETVDK